MSLDAMDESQFTTAALRRLSRVTGWPRGCQGNGTQFCGGGSEKVVVIAMTTISSPATIAESGDTTRAGRSFPYPLRSSIHANTIRPYRRESRDAGTDA